MVYHFYGWENADISALDSALAVYPDIRTPHMLYDALRQLWSAESCAPRLRNTWRPEQPTHGQCSITAFLAQDIFGGKVYGVLRPNGNYHCFNVVGDCVFDLTSEQFGDEALCYTDCPEQQREVHFSKEEKRLRYEALKEKLRQYCILRRAEKI